MSKPPIWTLINTLETKHYGTLGSKRNMLAAHQISWLPGVTSRNEYSCRPLCVTAIMLHPLCTISWWHNVETKLRLFASQFSEVFWELIEPLIAKYGHLLNLREKLLRFRMPEYPTYIKEAGAVLHRCVAFFDSTITRITRLERAEGLHHLCILNTNAFIFQFTKHWRLLMAWLLQCMTLR